MKMKVELISQEEMMNITGGGIGCWLGKWLARVVYTVSCNQTNTAAVCNEIITAKQES